VGSADLFLSGDVSLISTRAQGPCACGAAFSRSATSAVSSYSSCVLVAATARPERIRTTTVPPAQNPDGIFKFLAHSGSLPGLQRSTPDTATLPTSIAALARRPVLKNRAVPEPFIQAGPCTLSVHCVCYSCAGRVYQELVEVHDLPMIARHSCPAPELPA